MFAFSKKALFEVWCNERDKMKKKTRIAEYILNNVNLETGGKDIETVITRQVEKLCYKFSEKWSQCYRSKKLFLSKHLKWLEEHFEIPGLSSEIVQHSPQPSTSKTAGRPSKLFEVCSERTKRRRVRSIVETASADELLYATQYSLRSKGKRDAAGIVKQVTLSPKRATLIKKAFTSPPKCDKRMSKEEALATFMDGRMTKRSYGAIQKRIKSKGSNILPSYPFILKAKKECYPHNIIITEISAEIGLQDLIDHTIRRLCKTQMDVLKQNKNSVHDITLIFKWGCDGTSGFSQYKQRFSSGGSAEYDDSAMFVISLVPLQLYGTAGSNKLVLWRNETPSSTRHCRPVKLLLQKETSELTSREVSNIEQQIKQLLNTKINLEGEEVEIKPILILTMVDGKVCSALTDMSCQKCYICGCSPKEMNNIKEVLERSDDPTNYTFGLSPLHARIRCFECLLHISYRLDIKKWQVKENQKEEVKKRQSEIKKKFWTEMGLLVDAPKPGYGSTNDGNTARRFFENPALSASITGLDENIIKRFSIILQAINSQYEVNPEAFHSYAIDTFRRYVSLYPWYYLPSSVHKLLVHGAQIIKHALLPIGQLSEEAQEARHKEIKKYREHHSRKFSRQSTMTDIMHMLLISSDPLINSYRQRRGKSINKLMPEVLSLLSNLPDSELDKSEEEETLEGEKSSSDSDDYSEEEDDSSDSSSA